MSEQPKKTLTLCAMQYGVYLGLYFIVEFAFVIGSMHSNAANFMSTALLVATPAMIYLLMRHYVRQEGNSSRFVVLWLLGIYIFFFASLISGLAQYIYFQYIDPDWIPSFVEQQLQVLEAMGAQSPEMADFADTARAAIDNGASFEPIDVVFMMIWSNVFFGSLLSIVVAFFARMNNHKNN